MILELITSSLSFQGNNCYIQIIFVKGQDLSSMCNLEQAFKFFQHLTWASKTGGVSGKVGKNVGITQQSVPMNTEILPVVRLSYI